MPTDLLPPKLTIKTILTEAYQHMQGFKLIFWRGIIWVYLPMIIIILLTCALNFLLSSHRHGTLSATTLTRLYHSAIMIYLAYHLFILPMLLGGLEKLSLARVTGKKYTSQEVFHLLTPRYAKKFIPLFLLYLLASAALKVNLIDYPWIFWPLFLGLFGLFYFHRFAIINDASISLRRTLHFSWYMLSTYGLKLLVLLGIQLGLVLLSFLPAFIFFSWRIPPHFETLSTMILLSLTSLSGVALCWLIPFYYCIKATFYLHATGAHRWLNTSHPLSNLS